MAPLIRRRYIACLTVIVVLVGATYAPAAESRSLRITRAWPLQLDGRNFYAREHVRVTVRMGATVRSASVRSDGRGAFTADFAGLRLKACSTPLTISARGARGDVAAVRMPVRECAPDHSS